MEGHSFTFDTTSGKSNSGCVACKANCLECPEIDTCKTCKTGYKLKNKECQKGASMILLVGLSIGGLVIIVLVTFFSIRCYKNR